MKTWILAVVLGMTAIAPFLYLAYHNFEIQTREIQPRLQDLAVVQFQSETKPTKVEEGAVFTVLSCQVLDGYQFMLHLDGGGFIEAHLPVATKKEAIPVVIEAFNKATPPLPTVKLLRDVEGVYWIVDMHVCIEGKRERMVDYLREQELTLD